MCAFPGMTYYKHFSEPLSKRSCTDVCCLFIFIGFLVGWALVGCYGKMLTIFLQQRRHLVDFSQFVSIPAFKYGNLDRVIIPADMAGRKCGIDSTVIDKPYLFFFDLRKCTDIMTPFVGCQTPQVCVDKCPTTGFSFDMNVCKDNFDATLDKLICRLGVDKQQMLSCDDIKTQINSENCAKWYLESEPGKFSTFWIFFFIFLNFISVFSWLPFLLL